MYAIVIHSLKNYTTFIVIIKPWVLICSCVVQCILLLILANSLCLSLSPVLPLPPSPVPSGTASLFSVSGNLLLFSYSGALLSISSFLYLSFKDCLSESVSN